LSSFGDIALIECGLGSGSKGQNASPSCLSRHSRLFRTQHRHPTSPDSPHLLDLGVVPHFINNCAFLVEKISISNYSISPKYFNNNETQNWTKDSEIIGRHDGLFVDWP
jgi:hypothetical protein